MPRIKARLTKSEQEILETMWEYGKPVTSAKVVELATNKTWKSSSVHLLINSLLKKEYVEIAGFEKTTKNYARTFQPTMTRKEFILKDILKAFNNNTEEIFNALIKLSSKEVLLSAKASIEKELSK